MLISVIVPVFNAEKYLEECLSSILNSSYKDIELIVIDDGSNDNSPMICDKYASQNTNVIVKHKANAGVVSAIDDGIKIARGEKLVFIDSDDWIDEDYLANLVAGGRGVDMYCIGIYSQDAHGDMTPVKINCIANGKYSREELTNCKLIYNSESGTMISNSRCCKIVDKNIAVKASSECDRRIKIGEDMQFVQACLRESNTISVNNDIYGYYYRHHENSAMHTYSKNLAELSMALMDNIARIWQNSNIVDRDKQIVTARMSFLVKSVANEFYNSEKKEIKGKLSEIISLSKKYNFDQVELVNCSRVARSIVAAIKGGKTFKLSIITRLARLKNSLRK